LSAEPTANREPQAVRWLRECAWPLWLEHGIDWNKRAFHEHLRPDSLTCTADFRRLRVAARQTYVFSKAALLGVPRARDAVALGLEFLQGPARLEDGGYAWRFDLDNAPVDRTRDLYDHAFVLLALSAAAPIVGPDALRKDAHLLLEYVDRRLQHADGGYEESIPPTRPRRQNPHMHLLEALLEAHANFRETVYFERARELIDLFINRLFQRAEGTLPEYFDERLVPLRGENRCYIIEPGHHYEWVWLLDWYAQSASSVVPSALLGIRSNEELGSASAALLSFANRYALDRKIGLVVNELWSDGSLRKGGFRLWPQAERLKAEARRQQGADIGTASAFAALSKHLEGAPSGLWEERIHPDGRPTGEPAPATSLYHLTAALTDPAVLAHVKHQ
jgi:mannose/cellobiose epimerase-like protein (N-acyl-D-glucosamine 2-epimerase family)